jgi:hypothetical protein
MMCKYLDRFAKQRQITATKSFQSVSGPDFPHDKKRYSAEAVPASVGEEVIAVGFTNKVMSSSQTQGWLLLLYLGNS